MAELALNTVFRTQGFFDIQNHGNPQARLGTIDVSVADIDVYESNADVRPEDANIVAEMRLTQTLAFGKVYEYGQPTKWIAFKSAGAAIVKDLALIKD